MKKRLKRPLIDRVSALALPVVIAGAVMLENQHSAVSLLVYGLFFVASVVNALFFLSTPIGLMEESVLLLYSEAVPVVINLWPQRIELKHVSELLIDKKAFFPRAIFCLPHGQRVYHGFPARSDKRIKLFLEFLGNNVRHRIVE